MRGRSCALTSIQVVFACAFAAVLQLASASASASATADAFDALSEPDSEVIQRIIGCTTAGKEAVLLQEGVECKDYRTGVRFLPEDMPLKADADRICAESENKPKDWRLLSGNAIKRIVGLTKPSADPRGIRIFGAVFCKQLDLSGLDLSYSLVMDRSLFLDGFEARNFHTRGDLSIDGSLALGVVTIMRSRIGGTAFGNKAYIKQLRILDSSVQGSLIFRESVIPEPAIFDTVSVLGELSVRGSALSYLILQFSKVGGVLDLTESQARCAYVIKKSEIGDLVAVEAGFGTSTSEPPGDHGSTQKKELFDWRSGPNADPVRGVNSNPRSTLVANNRECNYWTIAFPGNFLVSDTRVRSSLCVRSFHWFVPRINGQPSSFVTINNVEVSATSFIDLMPSPSNVVFGPWIHEPRRKFEIVGLKTHSLIFNFDAGAHMSDMSVGGLAFEHAYTFAKPEVKCAYDPRYYEPYGVAEVRLDVVPRSQYVRLPRVAEIMSWLDKNCLQTTQPLSAFVDAAKRAGDVADATQLQIARETKELQLRIQRLQRALGMEIATNCNSQDSAPGTSSLAVESASNIFDLMSDVAAVLFGSFLWLVADHGFRPQKVGWFVLATLIGAVAYFWLWVQVVGFLPAKKNTVRLIGLAFLFDRLLPAFRIREEHYSVESYYKLAFKSPKANSPCSEQECIRYMNLLWFKIPLVKANEGDVQRVERCLDIIKAIGIVLAIFLVAAINELVRH